MAVAGFHSIAKLRAQIRNAVLVDHGVFQADCHRENFRNIMVGLSPENIQYFANCQSL
jgi:hypothetical protein